MKMRIALLVVSLSSAVALLASEPGEEKPLWHADWPTVQRLARQANKPIFVVMACKH